MKNLWMVLLLLFSTEIFAADGAPTPVTPPRPTPLLVKQGSDYFIDFQDGRKAGFFQQSGKVYRAYGKMRQIENTCDYAMPLTNCRLEFDISYLRISLDWAQHPDANKAGKTIQFNFGGERFQMLEEERYGSWYTSLQDPTYYSRFKPDRLICDDLRWADNIRTQNQLLMIESWTGEVMTVTSETNANENQTITGVFSVGMRKVDAKTLEFVSFGRDRVQIGIPPYIPQQVTKLTYIDSKNNQCQVSFEGDLTEALKVLRSPDFGKIDPTTRTNFRFGSLITNSLLSHYVSEILKNNGELE